MSKVFCLEYVHKLLFLNAWKEYECFLKERKCLKHFGISFSKLTHNFLVYMKCSCFKVGKYKMISIENFHIHITGSLLFIYLNNNLVTSHYHIHFPILLMPKITKSVSDTTLCNICWVNDQQIKNSCLWIQSVKHF